MLCEHQDGDVEERESDELDVIDQAVCDVRLNGLRHGVASVKSSPAPPY